MNDDSDGDLIERVRAVLQREGKIPAIRLYREQTGEGLAEAKEAVERIERDLPPKSPDGHGVVSETGAAGDEALLAEVKKTLSSDGKMAAIKAYRARTGAGLADSRRAVEQLERSMGSQGHSPLGGKPMAKKEGCLSLMMGLIAGLLFLGVGLRVALSMAL